MIIAHDNNTASRLKDVSTLAAMPVFCFPLATLKQSRGLVFSRDQCRLSQEPLLEELAHQQLVRVKRINKKMDGVMTRTPMIIITFNGFHLPGVLYAAR